MKSAIQCKPIIYINRLHLQLVCKSFLRDVHTLIMFSELLLAITFIIDNTVMQIKGFIDLTSETQ